MTTTEWWSPALIEAINKVGKILMPLPESDSHELVDVSSPESIARGIVRRIAPPGDTAGVFLLGYLTGVFNKGSGEDREIAKSMIGAYNEMMKP